MTIAEQVVRKADTPALLDAYRRDPAWRSVIRPELYRRGWRPEHIQFYTE